MKHIKHAHICDLFPPPRVFCNTHITRRLEAQLQQCLLGEKNSNHLKHNSHNCDNSLLENLKKKPHTPSF